MQGRVARREDLEPIAIRGRAAGITTGACVAVAGITLILSAWYELTCPLGGPRGRALCNRTAGIGGLTVMFGAVLVTAGAGILWRTSRRLLDPDGSSAWTWGEGLSIVAAGLTVGLLIPAHHCPPGYEMTLIFHACRNATSIIIDPPSWIGWKFAACGAGIVVGVVVARWRRLPWSLGSAITVAAVGGATWYLVQKTVGFPSF